MADGEDQATDRRSLRMIAKALGFSPEVFFRESEPIPSIPTPGEEKEILDQFRRIGCVNERRGLIALARAMALR